MGIGKHFIGLVMLNPLQILQRQHDILHLRLTLEPFHGLARLRFLHSPAKLKLLRLLRLKESIISLQRKYYNAKLPRY